MTDHQPLPVKGYTAQPQDKIDLVNEGKALEERVLRYLDMLGSNPNTTSHQAPSIDARALALGRTHIQTGFMWAFRAIFQPQRVKIEE